MVGVMAKDVIPTTLEEAIARMCDHLKLVSEDDRNNGFYMHHMLGMQVRNTWGLWRGNGSSPLVLELNALGLFHADDMWGVIIECAKRDLAGVPRDIPAQVKVYQDHWAAAGVDVEAEGAELAKAQFNSTVTVPRSWWARFWSYARRGNR